MRGIRSLVLGFVLSTVITALGYHPLLRYLVEREVNDWFLQSFGQRVVAEKIVHKDGRLVFVDAVIRQAPTPGKSGHHLRAEQLEIAYNIDWWSRTFNADIHLARPRLECHVNGSMPLGDLIQPAKGEGFLALRGSVRASEGVIELKRSSRFGETLERLYVDVVAERTESWAGRAEASFDARPESGGQITLAFQEGEKEATADILVSAVHCSDFAKVCHFLYGQPLEALLFEEGRVDGRLLAVVPQKLKPYLEGDLQFSQLRFAHADWGFEGNLGLARIRLHELPERIGAQANPPLGQLEILEAASLAFKGRDEAEWEINNLTGGVFLYAQGPSKISLQGDCLHQNDAARLTMSGDAVLLDPAKAYIDLGLKLDAENRPTVAVQVNAHQVSSNEKRWELHCRNLGRPEYAVFRSSLGGWLEQLQLLELNAGMVNGSLLIDVVDGHIAGVALQGLNARDLQVDCPKVGMSFSTSYLGGSCELDLSADNVFGTLNSDLVIKDGLLRPYAMAKSPWQIEGLETRIQIHKGIFQRSLATAVFAGMQGNLSIDWKAPQDILSFDFNGPGRDFAQWLPADLRARINYVFAEDQVRLKGGLRRHREGTMLHGSLLVDGLHSKNELIQFGWDLDQVNQTLWPSAKGAEEELQWLSTQVLRELAPQSMRPAAEMLSHWLDAERGVFGMVARRGWVRADRLPLQRYVGPIIFDTETDLALSGLARVEGSIEGKQVVLRYSGRDVRLKGGALDIHAKEVGSAEDLITDTQYPGRYYINFGTLDHFGWVPIHGAQYHEKAADIHFEETDALVLFGQRRTHAIDLTTYAEGVYFSGAVDVVGSGEDRLVVTAQTSEISGEIAGVRRLLHRVDSEFIGSMPLEGTVKSGLGHGYLQVVNEGGQIDVSAYVQGSLLDGTMNAKNGLLSLQGVSSDFDYAYPANAVAFHNLQGNILVGDSRDGDEYSVSSRSIRMHNFPDSRLSFDIRVEDSTRDYIRFQGEGITEYSDNGDRVVRLLFDPETTHIGAVRPNISHLVMKDWQDVYALRADPTFDLSSLPEEVRRLSKTGLLNVSSSELDFLLSLGLRGDIRTKLDYDPEEGRFIFTATGEGVSARQRRFEECFLSGKYAHGAWTLDQLQLDDLSIAADLVREEEAWRLGFLGVRYGNALLLGMKGSYLPEQSQLQAKIDLLELDFASDPLPRELAPHVERWKAHGQARGSGSLSLDFSDPERWCSINAEVNTTLRDLSVAGIHAVNHQQVHARYRSGEGLTIDNLQAILGEENAQSRGVGLAISSINFLPETQTLNLKRAGISVPASRLHWFARSLQTQFPKHIGDELVGVISQLKEEGSVSGITHLTWTPEGTQISIELQDDSYSFLGATHQLRKPVIDVSPYEVSIRGQYGFKDHYLGMLCSFSPAMPDRGTLLIKDTADAPEQANDPDVLVVDWYRDAQAGLGISRAHGHFAGLELDLAEDKLPPTPSELFLVGQVGGNLDAASWLLGEGLAGTIQKWSISTGLMIGGQFAVSKEEAGTFRFDGNLSGEDFYLKGYQFDSLFAHMTYDPQKLEILDLRILDPALSAELPRFTIEMLPDGWDLEVPSLLATDLKPDLLRTGPDERPEDSGTARSLLIEELQITDLKGDPSVPDSIQGNASLRFVNPSKINQPDTILSIPKDIIARIGLSTSVLNPVTGTLLAKIQGGRFNFTKFQDVFSQGRVSRFYLSEDALPSYMDFDGNLNLRVKMKQYNLLFKFTELFTITVHGRLTDPQYTLKKLATTAEGEDELPEAQ